MPKFDLLFLLGFLFFSGAVFAQDASLNKIEIFTENIPKAACLKDLAANKESIIIGQNCLHRNSKSQTQDSWRNEEDNESYEYKYLGEINSKIYVSDLYAGGGSLKASTIKELKINQLADGKIRISNGDILVSGDRCMNGIDRAWIKNGQLYASVRINEYELINIVDWAQVKKYEDDNLDTPNNCIGNAFYKINTEDKIKNLLSIEFDKNFIDAANGTDEFWPCLQYIVSQYIRKHGRTATAESVSHWANDIKKSCPSAYE